MPPNGIFDLVEMSESLPHTVLTAMRKRFLRAFEFSQSFGSREHDVCDDVAQKSGLSGSGWAVHGE